MDINLAVKILNNTSRLKFSDNEQESLKTIINELDKRRDIITNMAIYISKLDIDEDICKHIYPKSDLDCEDIGRECISCLIEWFSRED